MSDTDWWTEDRRGKLIGYGHRSGNYWTHLVRLRDEGPGAVSMRASCGGIQGAILLASKSLPFTDEVASNGWKESLVKVPVNGPMGEEKKWTCKKCVAIVGKAVTKAAEQ